MDTVSLLRELLDCRQADERPAQAIVRLYHDFDSPMHAAARSYVNAMRLGVAFRESNPKIDIYRDELGKGEYDYRSSTKWYRTCRDAEIAAMLAQPDADFKACRSKTA